MTGQTPEQWARGLADALLQNRRDAIDLFGDTYYNLTRNVGVVIKGQADASKRTTLDTMKSLAAKLVGRQQLAMYVGYVELVAPGGERDQLVQALLKAKRETTSAAPGSRQGGAA